MGPFLCMSLLQAAHERLVEPLKKCGTISSERKIAAVLEVYSLSVIESYCYNIRKG